MLMDEPDPRNEETTEPHEATAAESWDEPLLADDLEAAYLRALEASEAVEREMDAEPTAESEVGRIEVIGSVTVPEVGSEGSASSVVEPVVGNPESAVKVVAVGCGTHPTRVSERQVVEAALFVGGMPLTAKKLSSLFHTDHGFGFVECLIDELNQLYEREGRPYSIMLGEGGYRMSLLPEFESVRNKVFGYGPKDVKLTQDALEVLSLVAYKQPITRSQMEVLGKLNSGSILRQLLQRELIRIDRAHSTTDSKSKNDPPYVTTPRFLSLFGIGSVRDLPVAEDIEFK